MGVTSPAFEVWAALSPINLNPPSVVQETYPVQQVPRQEGVDVGEMIETDDANGLAHGHDAKLDALAVLTRSIIETHGWPTEEAKEAFFAAG